MAVFEDGFKPNMEVCFFVKLYGVIYADQILARLTFKIFMLFLEKLIWQSEKITFNCFTLTKKIFLNKTLQNFDIVNLKILLT